MLKVSTLINAHITHVWELFTNPKHIVNWHNASDDWHVAKATNNLKKGGSFSYLLAAKNGSLSFEMNGIYSKIIVNELIEYTFEDERQVSISFKAFMGETIVVECFKPETKNSFAIQLAGWQAILNNFKNYAEETRQ
jgi:uncharacterized protein YndB with AHSA1/START domain